jgi:hypothetical protein
MRNLCTRAVQLTVPQATFAKYQLRQDAGTVQHISGEGPGVQFCAEYLKLRLKTNNANFLIVSMERRMSYPFHSLSHVARNNL